MEIQKQARTMGYLEQLMEAIRKEKLNKEEYKDDDPEIGAAKINELISALTPRFEQPVTVVEEKQHGSTLAGEIENIVLYELDVSDKEESQIQELERLSKKIDDKIISNGIFTRSQDFRIDYASELNPAQLAAVATTDRPLLVIAGAGSGKTRIITYKVAYLIEKGVMPSEILLLTFTRKSANEMIRRVEEILQKNNVNGVLGGTFHSFANHALRRYGKLAGVNSSFTIIDTKDTEDIIDLIKTELKIKSKVSGRQFPNKSKVQAIISKSKNLELPIQDIINRYYNDLTDFEKQINTIDTALTQYKQRSNLLDYDDLMHVLRNSLRDLPPFKQAIQRTMKYILVDEYQDTNNVQREIVELLADKDQKVTVVGDDSQSIYAFRGANFENILRFPSTYSNCGVVKLEQNYRSQSGILNFTNDVIDDARIGFKKILYSSQKEHKKPVLRKFGDANYEAEYIVDRIEELKQNDLNYSDFAVLTRASWHSQYVQTEMTRRGIPFIVVGGIKFSERRHVKDLLAFLKILINPLDAVAWHRILRLLEGVGKVRAGKIVEVVHRNHGAIDFSEFEGKAFYEGLDSLGKVLRDLQNDDITLVKKIEKVVTYYKPILKKVEDDYAKRVRDIEIFVNISDKYDDLERFLSDFTLEPPSNQFQDENFPMAGEEKDLVTVSTIHSAKGLEWHTVFIPFALDGLLPSSRSLGSVKEIEEERRLFYVATTRAKVNLFITMPGYVSSWDAYFTQPSRFLGSVKKVNYVIED